MEPVQYKSNCPICSIDDCVAFGFGFKTPDDSENFSAVVWCADGHVTVIDKGVIHKVYTF